jgi:hypothetical protein
LAEERDLSLRITADAAQAKAELDSLQKSEQGLVASTEAATVATTGSANAIKAQGDAAAESNEQVSESSDVLSDAGSAATVAGLAQQKLGSAITGTATATGGAVVAADAHVVAFRAEQVATERITLAFQEARASITGLASATAAGGAEMTAAVGRAAIAVAGLEIEMNAAGGGTAAQRLQLAGLNAELVRLVPALAADAAATGVLTAQTEKSAVAHKQQTLSIQAAGKAVAGHELSTAKLATGLLKMAAPVLGVVTVVALLPQVIKLVVDKTTEWSNKIGDLMAGLDSQAGVMRKSGESTADYQKRVNEAADANEELDRAVNASRAGIIGVTGDSERLRAEWILHAEAMNAGSQSAEKLAFAYKELGLKMVESLKFEDARADIESFIRQYDNELKKGENSARRFTDANKEFILARMEAYEDEGQAISADLQQIADKYGIVTQKQKESVEAAQAQLAAWESLTPKARALMEESERFLELGIKTGEAFVHPKIQVENLLDSIKKLETEGSAAFAATLEAMGNSITIFTDKAQFASAAIDALYSGDDESFTPGRTYTPPSPE